MLSRRGVLAGSAGCVLCGSTGQARISPLGLRPVVGLGYAPTDADERGLWRQYDQLETETASSALLLRDPAMQAYVAGVMTRLLGAQAKAARIYIVHDPVFNASMTPTGMMTINTGLLARVRDEAQLAAVLGHESGHYLLRHQVASWRDRKFKTGAIAFVSAGTGVLAGAAYAAGLDGGGWYRLANSVNVGLAQSIFSFSRAQESEADAFGLGLMDRAGYAPEAAAAIWTQLSDENRASAAARGRRYRDGSRSVYSTHPPNDMRMLDLTESAHEVTAALPGRTYDNGRDRWRAAVAPLRAELLAEQVKLNDPGASLYLIGALARDGWDGMLHYYRGETLRLRDEPGDAAAAAAAYAAAVACADAPPEAWRAHGYAALKAGQRDDGRRALTRYLDLLPGARDAAMVRLSLQ